MRIRPVHSWWLGVALFAPSVLVWLSVFGVSIYRGMFNCPFDWHGIRFVYLPFLAAFLGSACGYCDLPLGVLRSGHSLVILQ